MARPAGSPPAPAETSPTPASKDTRKAASTKSGEPASAQRQKELQAEQKELKEKLASLKKSLAASESAHSEAADALAASESAISAASRHLERLAAARRKVEERIDELHASERDLANAQGTQSSRRDVALRSEYVLLEQPELESIVSPAAGAREAQDSAYLDVVVRERWRRIGELHGRRAELAALEAESVQRSAQLAKIDVDERAGRAQLLKQETARKNTLARLSREIDTQRKSVAKLERDDSRMASLIDEIGRLLADQARRRATARSKTPGGKTDERNSAGLAPDHFEPPSSTHFGRLRGTLLLPVQGPIGSKYGAARLADDGQPQAGAPAWKGLFIRAEEGSPVHAVAAGRVVFADWLRGFGNLIILDHGEGFLSVYADNETLLRSVGDSVKADEVIASVGNTGGNAQSGLYFEMRYQGRPFDPLAWAVAR